MAAVAARLEEKRAKAAAEQAAKQETAETVAARLDPQLLRSEKGREHLMGWANSTGVDPLALYEALAELGERLEREANADPTDRRLSKLERDAEAKRAREAAEAKADGEARATKAFLGAVTADKFPLLASLDPAEIMTRGVAAARALTRAGEDPDAETIAAVAEMELRKLHGKLAAKGSGTTTTTAGSAEPRTLSGSLGGETPEPPPFVPGRAGVRQRMKAAAQRRR